MRIKNALRNAGNTVTLEKPGVVKLEDTSDKLKRLLFRAQNKTQTKQMN